MHLCNFTRTRSSFSARFPSSAIEKAFRRKEKPARTPVNLNNARCKADAQARKSVSPVQHPLFFHREFILPLGSRRTSARPFTTTRIPPATRRTPDTVFSRHEPAKVQAAYIIYTISRGVCRVRQNMKPASDAALR